MSYQTLVLMLVQFLQIVFFAFGIPCNFLLKGGHDVLGVRNCSKWVFSNRVGRRVKAAGRVETFCSPRIRS